MNVHMLVLHQCMYKGTQLLAKLDFYISFLFLIFCFSFFFFLKSVLRVGPTT